MYVPLIPTAATVPDNSNKTSEIIEEKLKGTESKLTESLGDVKKELDKSLDDKLNAVANKANSDIDTKLKDAVNQGERHLSSVAAQSSEKLDAIKSQLASLNEKLEHFCITGDNMNITLTRHHEAMLDEFKCLVNHMNESESLHKTMLEMLKNQTEDSHEKKVLRDENIKRNIQLRVEVADDENPAIGKLLPLTPIVTARKLRQIWNSQMGKGMVSVCYHNQPKPFSEDHPLVEPDDPLVRSVFNGTMDSAHNLQSGLNLDTPYYINALMMELQSLNREYVSLCLEDPAHNVEFYHSASCINLVVGKK